MKTNFLIALILGVFVTYIGSSVSLADYVIDDFQTADVTAAPSVTVSTQVSSSAMSNMSINRVASNAEGYRIVYSGSANGDEATATIEYSFTNGLRNLFQGAYAGAKQNTPVKFYMPVFINNLTEGTFTVNVIQSFANNTESITEITPDAQGTTNSMFEIGTQRTSAQLGTIGELEDIDMESIAFEIKWSPPSLFFGGTDQVIFLGGGSGVNPNGRVGSFTAIPEPTSAAMIGCALVGLVARRRRKS